MSSVTLYVYDITSGMAKGMSMMLIGQQIDAIYHTSLVVFGKEYYFGAGICADPPKSTPFGKPIQEVPLG
jgi:desumoylating isopeptidase 1